MTMMTKEDALMLISEAIEELNEQLDDAERVPTEESVSLIGATAAVDSMGFVTLISIVEELVEEKFGKTISIVNAKAFSQDNSPFATLDSLAEYVVTLAREV